MDYNETIKFLYNQLPVYQNSGNKALNLGLDKIQKLLIELNNMIGLYNVKSNILDQILFYLQDLHLNSGIDYMHTVLYGSPGTGKTEISKIIGKIFTNLGILKKGTFKKDEYLALLGIGSGLTTVMLGLLW